MSSGRTSSRPWRDHHLRITDIKPAPAENRAAYPDHEYFDLDATSGEAVIRAAHGMDAIVNLSVVRRDPRLAFHVNTLGCYHIAHAAVHHGIRRVINTGPHFTVAGPSYEALDFAIGPDVPPHPGTGLYPLTKSLGQEILRIFALEHNFHALDLLYYILRDESEIKPGAGGVPFMVTWSDAAEAVRLALAIPIRPAAFARRDLLHLRRYPAAEVHATRRRSGFWGFAPRAT